ncbi:MAG: hypothetical protein COB04_09900 [Gammaproteobacteria bacterium]|nr:MAG: hypothetical protein COB04_09900 [Gammaproteobacteria bacterium]
MSTKRKNSSGDGDVASMNGEKDRFNKAKNIKEMVEVRSMSIGEMEHRKIIYPGMDNRSVLNAFREIRTRLVERSSKKNFIVLVSSIVPEGGGSLVALNLAAALALDQTKTALLIDCNLYEASIDSLLSVKPEAGLTDYLVDESIDVDDIIYDSGIRRLRVIPIGQNVEGAAEHFSSSRMVAFINSIRERYHDRYIVIDAPPVGLSAEGRILAELSDFSMLVIPYGRVTDAQIQSGIAAVNKEKLAGVVFNNK